MTDAGTSRRDFLRASLGTTAWALSSSSQQAVGMVRRDQPGPFTGFAPAPMTSDDALAVAPGYDWRILVSRGDVINKAGDTFGECCDFTQFIPGDSATHGYLWVNHEYIVSNTLWKRPVDPRTKDRHMVDQERALVGGSLLEIEQRQGRWRVKQDSTRAFRVTGTTPIPIVGPAGGRTAVGMVGNCSGGLTPWGRILTCEENFDNFYDPKSDDYHGWARHYEEPLVDYGWVVEVDPTSKQARKLTSLGRFAHEGAAVGQTRDGRAVVYMGDDKKGECLYKFVSRHRLTGDQRLDQDALLHGTLYVANLSATKWEALTPEHEELSKTHEFSSLAAILTHTRRAAKIAGGTPLNRPEGVIIDQHVGRIYAAFSNNSKAGDFYGSLFRLEERDGDLGATEFSFETHAVGGETTGFACPDNLAWGPGGSLWMATDVSGKDIGSGAYRAFPRNIFARLASPTSVERFLVAPPQAEFTGPCFHHDSQSLFISVQHPGEYSYHGSAGLTSSWPRGAGRRPLSSVITVSPR